jgi:hypothetical protein
MGVSIRLVWRPSYFWSSLSPSLSAGGETPRGGGRPRARSAAAAGMRTRTSVGMALRCSLPVENARARVGPCNTGERLFSTERKVSRADRRQDLRVLLQTPLRRHSRKRGPTPPLLMAVAIRPPTLTLRSSGVDYLGVIDARSSIVRRSERPRWSLTRDRQGRAGTVHDGAGPGPRFAWAMRGQAARQRDA